MSRRRFQMRILAAIAAIGVAAAGTTTGLAQAPSHTPESRRVTEMPSRPDIIVIYLDDVNPHDGRLWSDPRRTPALAELFAESGTTFTSAIGETPLCCPGRAGFLTGLHTSEHGVDENDITPFDPRVTVATELSATGFQTFYVGKYLNELRTKVPRRGVRRYARGWDEFDVVYEDNGRWYDYALWTRQGVRRKGHRPQDHMTAMIERRAARHIRDASTEAPLFAFLSIFHTHVTNLPLPRYKGARRCSTMPPWQPPNFNEADVSDKPAYIRERRRFRRPAWGMRRYCEEMLGVDHLVNRLRDIQRARGRLDDTLFIFTADNGAAWGAHRLGQVKGVPYATPVPLTMTWPARWGSEARVIDEPVSNIDIAPTLCDIAGCEMGPFVGGPVTASGLSLLPLLDGTAGDLGRERIREQSGPNRWTPQFWAIRTTPRHPLGQWHYVEYETGERELYDAVADPWELRNLAADPAYAETSTALAAELREEFGAIPPERSSPR